MIQLELTRFAKARIWIGDLPSLAEVPPIRSIEYVMSVGSPSFKSPRKAAVELFIPMGGFAAYGLLGGEWTPADSDQLAVLIPISSADGPNMPDSLGHRIDDVRVGLPDEYVRGALDGLCIDAAALGAGCLRVTHACHGLVGSSLRTFRLLGRILTNVLAMQQLIPNELRNSLRALCELDANSEDEFISERGR